MARLPGGRRFAGLFVTLLLGSLLLPTGVALGGATSTAGGGVVPLATGYECYSDYDVPVCNLDIIVPETATAGTAFNVTVKVMNDGVIVSGGCSSGFVSGYYFDQGTDASTDIPNQSVTDGQVTFPLTIDSPGTFALWLSYSPDGPCGGVSSAQSDDIVVTSPGVVVTCPANAVCNASTQSASGNAKAVVTAGPGATITAAFGTLDYTACGGTTPADSGGVLKFDVLNGKLLKLVQLTIDHSIAGTTKLANFKVCWNAPTTFKTAGGSWATADTEGGYTGNLPNCLSKNPTLPCILLRTKNSAGDATLHVIAKPGDPKGYVSK